MTLSLRPEHLRRYKDVARLLVKHGRSDLVRAVDADQALFAGDLASWESVDGDPEALAADLEALGPTFVKLGQLLSTRSDLLPPPYLEALARLQDRVEPIPFDAVEAVVAEELGVRTSKAFAELAAFLDRHTDAGRRYAFRDMMEEFRRALLRELDFRLEARNLEHLGESLRPFRRIVVPEPVDDYSSSRVLTMRYVGG